MTGEDFRSNPQVLANYSLLQGLGLFDYLDSVNREVRDYERLLSGAADIFRRTSVDGLLETTIHCISDKFLPSYLVFLWRAQAGHEDLVVKGYRNFKPAEIPLELESIAPFEPFFLQYPKPISYELFAFQLGDDEACRPLEKLRPEIIMPVIGPSGLYGLILVGPKLLEDQYAPAELVFLDRLMSFASLAIQNHLHYEHSVRDPKTGLYNHGFFMVRLNEEVSRCVRNERSFSVIVMDVDHFKRFNDGYGHIAGDCVLEHLSNTLRAHLRDEDVLSRFGGEEFTVLIPEADRDQAWIVAERLRQNVAEMTISWETPLPPVTISLGVAVFNPRAAVSANEMLRRADAALYIAKQTGRNRSTVWGGGLLFKSSVIRQKSGDPQ